LLSRGGAIAQRVELGRGWTQGIRDVWQHRWLVLRGALIGVWAGILPALGATAGTWMAYGHVVATSKDRSRFGKGDIRGIIAPEAANNAVAAGDLIPTLLFWVPGSASAALLVGSLLRYGILPGPRIMTEHLDLIYVIIWSYAFANVIGAGICFAISPGLAKVTHVPFVRVAAPVLITIALGAYQTTQDMGDLVALFLIGLLGWVMSRTGWPRAPLLIGFVLAGPMERYFVQTTGIYNQGEWIYRPGVLIIGAVLVAPFVWGLVSWVRRRREARAEAAPAGQRSAIDLVFSAVMFAVFAGALVQIQRFVPGARLVPLVIAVPGVVLAAFQLFRSLQGRSLAGDEGPPAAGELRSGLMGFLILGGFFFLIWVAGFHVAAVALMLLFSLALARMRFVPAIVYTAAIVAALTGMGMLLSIHWPVGILRGAP
jgi:hypothetical protein